jgi:hypothetical protein
MLLRSLVSFAINEDIKSEILEYQNVGIKRNKET